MFPFSVLSKAFRKCFSIRRRRCSPHSCYYYNSWIGRQRSEEEMEIWGEVRWEWSRWFTYLSLEFLVRRDWIFSNDLHWRRVPLVEKRHPNHFPNKLHCLSLSLCLQGQALPSLQPRLSAASAQRGTGYSGILDFDLWVGGRSLKKMKIDCCRQVGLELWAWEQDWVVP